MSTIINPKTHKGLIALFLMALLFSFKAAAQNEVAIGSPTTKSNAILWLNGNGSQGLILPVVTNKSAVSNPDKGMVVYDDSDSKVWYRSTSAWVEVGSGTGASTANLNLLLQGNQLQLRDGTTVLNSANIANGTQANGSFLVFNGGSWQYATLSGDVSGTNGAIAVNGIKGKTIATLPATTQALVYDPTANAGAGGWSFQALTTGGTVTNITGTAPVTVTNPTTIPTISIANSGITNSLLATDAVNSSKIQDATITGADIAATTITANKLAQSAATTGQVLKWNGTNWVPQNDDAGTGTVPTLGNGQLLTGNGTTNTATTITGDATLSGGAITIGNNAITTAKINASAVDATKLADNAVTSAKISDATITDADIANSSITATKLAQSGANNNQVLQWNGTNWVPVTLSSGGTVTQINTGNGLTGGPITNSGTISIASSGVGATELADNAVVANKISDNAVITSKINNSAVDNTKLADNAVTSVKISDGSITGADIGSTTITADKLAQSSAASGQVLKWNGTNWVPQNDDAGAGATPTLSNGQILIGNGTTNSAVALSGDATLAGGVITIGNNTITTAKINANAVDATKLADNTVTAAKISDGSITGADLATNIAISTTGNVSVNAPGIISGIGSGITSLNASNISSGSLALARITPGTNGQVLTTTAGVPAWQTPVTGATTLDGLTDATILTPSSGQLLVNDGAGQFKNVGMSGDATINSTGAVTLNNGASTRTNLGLGSLATLSTVDLAGGNVTGILPVANGGTGRSTWDGLLLGSPGNITDISTGTNGQFLRALGGTPSWQTLAVTSTDITDGTIIDADIFSAAAIDGTKVNPAFGAQNISTTGTIQTGQFVGNTSLVNDALVTMHNTATSGNSNGVYGETDSPAGAGVWGNTVAGGIGVSGFSNTNKGISGMSTSGIGVYGNSTSGNAGYFDGSLVVTGAIGLSATPNYGTIGQVLTSQGAGVVPIWGDGGSNWSLTGNAGTNPATNFIGTTDAQPLRFATGVGGTERMRIDAAGDVGIGTNNPRSKLEIQAGDLILSGSPGTPTTETDPPDINFVTLANVIKAKIWTSQTTNTLWISTSTDPTNNRYLTLDPNGNFGFSNTTPTEKVDITGNVKFSGALMPNSTAGTLGQVLISGGVGVPPTWADPSATTLINDTGTRNLFAGVSVATAGQDNAIFGELAGAANTGSYNVIMGSMAAQNKTTGDLNTIIGYLAGNAAGTGHQGNTLIGANAGQNATGGTNTFIGEKSGQFTTTGIQNVFIGNSAGLANTTGGQNVIIGYTANVGASGLTNAIAIGNGAIVSASNSMVLGNNVNVGIGTSAPINKLDVEGGVAIGATYSGTSTAPANGMIVQGNFGLGTAAPINKLDVEGGVAIGVGYSGTSTAPTNGMIVQGNVGIGIAAPNAPLQLASATANRKLVLYDVNNNDHGFYGFGVQSGELRYQTQSTLSNHRFYAGTSSTTSALLMTISGGGNVAIAGSLSKGSGTFKIDHPVDPENKYLYHSFVESPDMMNVYNGNIITNEQGEVAVTLPDYFEALNKDFRYQLTVIGTFAQAIVYQKIENNKFVIKTDKPNVEVSWQVTGIRKDPFAEKNRVIPEVEKEASEKGRYLHPEAYGKPSDLKIGIQANDTTKINH